ncbi:DUF1285 domain-containing protein [Phytohalomonas tamaricis]|uniref:DUF1285 domain-containing protein n=1 Tax=Phytohalomonas tamaricis TaxID=2081032 RepID=UPI000D0AD39D|nr:DUF1285 domain-containing protein [Phytohalomonas tamaricis]
MSLDTLLTQVDSISRIPPVDKWSPACCGELDLTISRDGRWYHEGSPFTNEKVRRLLSRLLRREADGEHYLVLPQEKWRIHVEDCAFLIVDADPQDGNWLLITDVGDQFLLDETHRLQLSEAVIPSVEVRFGLKARLHRNVFYRLAEVAQAGGDESIDEMGIISAGIWQPLGRLSAEQL